MPDHPGELIIRVRGLVNRFGADTIHDGLDLDVFRGEVLGVVGAVVTRSIPPRRDAAQPFHWWFAAMILFFFNKPAFEQCPRAMSSRPGETFTMPIPEKMAAVRTECHEVMKD